MFVRFDISILLFFAGDLRKELGYLVNLTKLRLDDNQFRGKLYVPYHIHNLAMHITVILCVFAQ